MEPTREEGKRKGLKRRNMGEYVEYLNNIVYINPTLHTTNVNTKENSRFLGYKYQLCVKTNFKFGKNLS